MADKKFNPNEHLMQLKSKDGLKDYLPVQYRLVWFRDVCPSGQITTEMIHLDLAYECEEEAKVWNNEKKSWVTITRRGLGIAIFRATVSDGLGGVATGYKSEKACSFPDWLEKAETGAIGRALAALGYGTQFAPELNEEYRIVDSPVERPQPQHPAQSNGHRQSVPEALDAAAPSPQQLASINKLAQHLGRQVEQPATFAAAKGLLVSLSEEYNKARKAS